MALRCSTFRRLTLLATASRLDVADAATSTLRSLAKVQLSRYNEDIGPGKDGALPGEPSHTVRFDSWRKAKDNKYAEEEVTVCGMRLSLRMSEESA